ncbi:MAG: hypothetical protein AB1756_00500 [Acidobacteriota bacterium]
MKGKSSIAKNFLLTSLVLLLLSWILFLYPFWNTAEAGLLSGLFIGSLSNFAIALGFFSAVIWSFDRPQGTFLATLFVGMLVKMIILALILVSLILTFHTNRAWLISSFMLYYFAFQILEVIFFVRYAGSLRGKK